MLTFGSRSKQALSRPADQIQIAVDGIAAMRTNLKAASSVSIGRHMISVVLLKEDKAIRAAFDTFRASASEFGCV